MKKLMTLILLLPLAAFAAEHGGKPMNKKASENAGAAVEETSDQMKKKVPGLETEATEHGGEAVKKKAQEHGGEAMQKKTQERGDEAMKKKATEHAGQPAQ